MTTDTPSAEALAEMRDVLLRNGFVQCDILACNCGSWHARYGLRERFDEMVQALSDADHPLTNDNGNKPLNALRELIAERDALHKRVSDYETRLSAIMPPDFKDWHETHKAEWPWVAANLIVSQRAEIHMDATTMGAMSARLAEVEAERDALRAWMEAHMHGACNGTLAGIPPRYTPECVTLRAALDAAQAPREVPKLSQADIEEIVLRVPYEGDTTTPWRAEWTEQIGAPLIRAVESRVRELCGVAP